MHVYEVLCNGENGGATWDTSNRGGIMRKVVSKEDTAGGRCDFFWTLYALKLNTQILNCRIYCNYFEIMKLYLQCL